MFDQKLIVGRDAEGLACLGVDDRGRFSDAVPGDPEATALLASINASLRDIAARNARGPRATARLRALLARQAQAELLARGWMPRW